MSNQLIQCPGCESERVEVSRSSTGEKGTAFVAECRDCGALFAGTEQFERKVAISEFKSMDGRVHQAAKNVLDGMSLQDLQALEKRLKESEILTFKRMRRRGFV